MADAWKEWWSERVDRVRDLVSIFQVLDFYGVRYHVRGVRGAVSCPFHGIDRRPSAYVYPESNSVFCFKEAVSRDVIRYCWDMKGGKVNIKFGALIYWIEDTFDIGHPDPPSEVPDLAALEAPEGPTEEELEAAVRRDLKSTEQMLVAERGKLSLGRYSRLCQALDITADGFLTQRNVCADDVHERLRKIRKVLLDAPAPN